MFSKPTINTIFPKPAFAAYPTPPPPPGGTGCTPGFWKTHPEDPFWPIPKDTLLKDVFAPIPGPLDSDDFQTALGYPGGSGLVDKARILLRAAAAAYLNALEFPSPAYPLTPGGVVMRVNTALGLDGSAMIIEATFLDDTNNDNDDCLFLIHGPAAPKGTK